LLQGKDGTLSPSGKPRVRLPADSALLQLPMNREKVHTAVGNHSDIVKFESEANRTYKVVCNDLKQFLPAAGISTKTLPGNSTYTDETLYTRISKTTPKRNPPMAHKMAAVVVPKTPTANNAPHRNPVSASPKRPDNPEKNIPATPKTRLLRRSLQKSLGLPLKHILGLLPIKNPANTSK
jgi:hypothetical protein